MIGLPFEKLDEEQQKKAIDACRYYNVEDTWWSDPILEMFHEEMKLKYGVCVKGEAFTWSLYCQGAGATFDGFMCDPELFIKNALVEYTSGDYHYRKIRYVYREQHGNFSAYNERGWQKGSVDGQYWYNPHEEDVEFKWIYNDIGEYIGTKVIGKMAEHYNAMEDAFIEAERIWDEFCKDKADELHRALEAEYNYQTSDEVVIECILINEFLFAPKNNRVILI